MSYVPLRDRLAGARPRIEYPPHRVRLAGKPPAAPEARDHSVDSQDLSEAVDVATVEEVKSETVSVGVAERKT